MYEKSYTRVSVFFKEIILLIQTSNTFDKNIKLNLLKALERKM